MSLSLKLVGISALLLASVSPFAVARDGDDEGGGHNFNALNGSSQRATMNLRGRMLQQCVGDDGCAVGLCCSQWGWCGTGPAYCTGTNPMPPPTRSPTSGGGGGGSSSCAASRCGAGWTDANSKCGTSCSTNAECPSGETCFAGTSTSLACCSAGSGPAAPMPPTRSPSSSGGGGGGGGNSSCAANRCGAGWTDANSKCGTSCSTNAECPSGENCFAGTSTSLSCCLAGGGPSPVPATRSPFMAPKVAPSDSPIPPPTISPNVSPTTGGGGGSSCVVTRCGTSWVDANSKCGTSCSTNAECPSEETCFADVSVSLSCCSGGGTGGTGGGGGGSSCSTTRCGAGWADADSKCGTSCSTNAECSSGETCFAGVSVSLSCCSNVPAPSPVPVPTPGGTGNVNSPAATLSIDDLQAGLSKYNSLQGHNTQATQALVNSINSITTSYSLYRQLAFVAHTIWESGGYQYNEELAAITHSAKDDYQICDWNTGAVATNGKFFYGRGYIQLSWCANYKAYGKDRMVNNDPDYFYNNPGLVANLPYSIDSGAWYFEQRVKDSSGRFGLTTKDINGPLECYSGNNHIGSKPQKRYQIFVALANQVGLTGYSEGGCYN